MEIIELIEAKEKSILATRRLAKMQLTWLRTLDDSQKMAAALGS